MSQPLLCHAPSCCAALTLRMLRPGGGGAARPVWDHNRAGLRHRMRGRPLHQVVEAQAGAAGRYAPAAVSDQFFLSGLSSRNPD